MHWYKYLYVGERAKSRRFSIIQNIRHGRFQPGVYVIVPAAGSSNILDILPASELLGEYYKKQESLLVLGIGASYDDVLETAGRIVSDLYRETGGFDLKRFLELNGQR